MRPLLTLINITLLLFAAVSSAAAREVNPKAHQRHRNHKFAPNQHRAMPSNIAAARRAHKSAKSSPSDKSVKSPKSAPAFPPTSTPEGELIFDADAGYCFLTIEETEAIDELFSSFIADLPGTFLNQDGTAANNVASYVDFIKYFINGAVDVTDEEILEALTLDSPFLNDTTVLDFLNDDLTPSRSLVAGVPSQGRHLVELCDECLDALGAVVISAIVLVLELIGFKVDINRLIGRAVWNFLKRRSSYVDEVFFLSQDVATTAIEKITGIFISTFTKLQAKQLVDIIDDIEELTWWKKTTIIATFVAQVLAIAFTGGFALAVKLAKLGLATFDFVNALDNLNDCECPLPPSGGPGGPGGPTGGGPTGGGPTGGGPTTGGAGGTRRSGVFGDPHLSTFDRLRFDCQAAGEFTMVTSLHDPTFVIQERFTAVGSGPCSQASVSTGIAIRDTDIPTVQVSIPRGTPEANTFMVGRCPVDLWVDGTRTNLLLGTGDASVQVSVISNSIGISVPSTGVRIDLTVRVSSSFGCLFLVQVVLPINYRSNETVIGLLGKPNGFRSDDWVAPNGTSLSSPINQEESLFSAAYNYCVDNWCIRDESASIFSYLSGESFMQISGCDEDYANEIEDAVEMADPALSELCNGELFCVVDGICGGEEDALLAAQAAALVQQLQEASNPSPSATPSIVPSSSVNPSDVPTRVPSVSPTESRPPSESPSKQPSISPSKVPSETPSLSDSPSSTPTASTIPSVGPSKSPHPSAEPSEVPSITGKKSKGASTKSKGKSL